MNRPLPKDMLSLLPVRSLATQHELHQRLAHARAWAVWGWLTAVALLALLLVMAWRF